MTHYEQLNLLTGESPVFWWKGEASFDEPSILAKLRHCQQPYFVVRSPQGVVLADQGNVSAHPESGRWPCLGTLPGLSLASLGDPGFMAAYGTRGAYMAGAMANGISSVKLVIALGKAGFLASFGAGGLPISKVEDAVAQLKDALPHGPFAINVLHQAGNPSGEFNLVTRLLKHQISVIEASAFLSVTPALVYYRVSGLVGTPRGSWEARHKIIAKVSRQEVATQFMEPPNPGVVRELLERRLITAEQAALAARVSVADDVTVEADSGGHTDNRPLVSLLPAILALRSALHRKHPAITPVRVGAGGGIGTPASALAAFTMGAAYVVTGSINQACIESGTSDYVRQFLAQAEMADVVMAPSADMFELGARVQVLKKGTMYALHAQKLYELYRTYPSLAAIPANVLDNLEKRVFKSRVDGVWEEVVRYFTQHDSHHLTKAAADAKHQMALIFRWYLGNSSRWAIAGTRERSTDMQIWCGQSMGAFNAWTKNTYLEAASNRRVVDVAYHLMHGSLYLHRCQGLRLMGVALADANYIPEPLATEQNLAAV